MSLPNGTSSHNSWLGAFTPLIKVLGGLVALVTLSPIATYFAAIGPPVSFLTDNQVVFVSLTASLALYGILAATRAPNKRPAAFRKACGLVTVFALFAYVWLHSEFVLTLPGVNNSSFIVGHRYSAVAEAVRAAHPGISDSKLLCVWFACEVDDCYDPASTRGMNRAMLALWIFFWLAFSALIWAICPPRSKRQGSHEADVASELNPLVLAPAKS